MVQGWLILQKKNRGAVDSLSKTRWKLTSIFPEVLGEVIRLRTVVDLRTKDFRKVEPKFSGVGPSFDVVRDRGRAEVEVLDEALAHQVDGFGLEETLRPNEISFCFFLRESLRCVLRRSEIRRMIEKEFEHYRYGVK